jgi:uncharacterized protein
MVTSADIARVLSLEPHPEGGFYRETYRADELVATPRGSRAASSAILYLVTAGGPSRFHRLVNDEIWCYHGGSLMELVTLLPDGRAQSTTLAGAGTLVRSQELTPQALVPGGAWQAARVVPGAGVDWTLVTCIVTPAFDFDDFELATAVELSVAYPEQAELIAALT